MTILTVDDAATVRMLVAMTLRKSGHEVLEARDGEEALDIMKSHPIDLVITDVNMPKLNGIELTRRVRAMRGMRRMPILLLTTERDPAKKLEGRVAGATGWIMKPFNQEHLVSLVNKVLPGDVKAFTE
jgi:two-component system chemotaxis response regulator CheY